MIPIHNDMPTYTLTLPSTGKTIEYRPFVEKERKLLLMALETNDKIDILKAIKAIIHACCFNTKVESLALFDIEYIFLHLRAKSIGEIMKLNFKCNHISLEHPNSGNIPCNNIMHPEVDLTTVIVEGLTHDLKIKFNELFGVK